MMRFQTFLEEVKNNPDCFGRSLSSEVSILPIQKSAYDRDTCPNIALQPLGSLNPALAPHRGICCTSDLCSAHHRGQSASNRSTRKIQICSGAAKTRLHILVLCWVPAVNASCAALPLLSLEIAMHFCLVKSGIHILV